jgi:sugar fermentation stimulation protein A
MGKSKNVQKILASRMRKKTKWRRPGTYSLIVKVDDPFQIQVGALGDIEFKRGYYVYTGSAMNDVESRIRYHRKNKERLHYHIDYLLHYAKLSNVLVHKSRRRLECRINREIGSFRNALPIKGFGASDCRCSCHLFYFKNNPIRKLKKYYMSLRGSQTIKEEHSKK